MRSVRFVTFGCKANQYDTQLLREALGRRGWSSSGEAAELVVVNTCTVTAEAGRKARQLIRRVHREEPGARICVTGCLAELEREALRELPGVEWVLEGSEARRPGRLLETLGVETLGEAPDEEAEELGVPAGISAFHGHQRAFLKIQDGCDQACSFCIIPSVRGASRSRPADEIAAELWRLVRAGHAEVVLCGIHIGHWGREWGGELADLLARLVTLEMEEARPFRLRLSSIEATEVTEALLEVMAAHPERIAPHLHLPLQSGDDAVLKAMNRWYTGAEYLAAIERIRTWMDEPALSADVILGFPGEDRGRFENTASLVEAAGLTRLHVFPFSPRPGTAAAELPAGAPPELLREWKGRLTALAARLSAAFARRLDGREELVVPQDSLGLTGRYQRVPLDLREWPEPLPGLAPVRLAAIEEEGGGVRLVGRYSGARRRS